MCEWQLACQSQSLEIEQGSGLLEAETDRNVRISPYVETTDDAVLAQIRGFDRREQAVQGT
jgi:hypothetical protein